MPTISFSQNFLVSTSDTSGAPTKAIARIICGPTGVNSQWNGPSICGLLNTNVGGVVAGYYANRPWFSSGIYIMKGTIPTNFTGLTAATLSSSPDVLIRYTTGNITRIVSSNPAVISSSGVAATASGTATWVWIWSGYTDYFQNTSPSTTIPQAIQNQIIGNVGPIGSGADLEISDTNIVSGRSYFISKLLIRMPDTITY